MVEKTKMLESMLTEKEPSAEFTPFKVCDLTAEEAGLLDEWEGIREILMPKLFDEKKAPPPSKHADDISQIKTFCISLWYAGLYWVAKNHGLLWVDGQNGRIRAYDRRGKELWCVNDEPINAEAVMEVGVWLDRAWTALMVTRAIARTKPQPGVNAPGC